jgi:hypothetical protein
MLPLDASIKKTKVSPVERVNGAVLTHDTEITAVAVWPALNTAGLTEKVTREPVWPRVSAGDSSTRATVT